MDADALRTWALGLDVRAVAAFETGSSTNRFEELHFENAEDEAGFIALAHALDFGSGFRKALHARHAGKGAWLTIRAGLVRLGRASTRCEAAWLASRTRAELEALFELDSPDGSLDVLADHITAVVHELGCQLTARGFASMGAFVRFHLVRSKTHPASTLVAALVDTFPTTFDDRYTYRGPAVAADGSGSGEAADGVRGQEVFLFKKAQLVVSELFHRFAADDAAFAFPDMPRLTAFVDNVVVAMLRQLGVVRTTDAVADAIARGDPLPRGSNAEIALRAASLRAIEEAVDVANAGAAPDAPRLMPATLCNWLWGWLGKQPAGKAFPRHATPDTLFY